MSAIIEIIKNNFWLGILVSAIYFVWNQNLVSIVCATDTEMLLFSYGQKQIHKFVTRGGLWLIFSLSAFWVIIILRSIPFAIDSNLIFIVSMLLLCLFLIASGAMFPSIKYKIKSTDKTKSTLVILSYMSVFIFSIAGCSLWLASLDFQTPLATPSYIFLIYCFIFSIFSPFAISYVVRPFFVKSVTHSLRMITLQSGMF